MKQRITVITRKTIDNPDYNENEAKKLEEKEVEYPLLKKIEEVQRTTITINGLPDVVKNIVHFITDTFEVE